MDWFLYDNGLRHERVNSCFSDGSVNKTIDSVVHDERLDNLANLQPLNVDFDADNELFTESLQK